MMEMSCLRRRLESGDTSDTRDFVVSHRSSGDFSGMCAVNPWLWADGEKNILYCWSISKTMWKNPVSMKKSISFDKDITLANFLSTDNSYEQSLTVTNRIVTPPQIASSPSKDRGKYKM